MFPFIWSKYTKFYYIESRQQQHIKKIAHSGKRFQYLQLKFKS